MIWLVILLGILLLVSMLLNYLQWFKWHAYRSKPAGTHSYTGMIPIQRKHE